MSTQQPVKIRVNIAGYSGEAVSLYAAFDPANDLLLIAKVAPYTGDDRDGFLKVTNQDRDQFHDAKVTDDDIVPAINAYFQLDSLHLLTYGKGTENHSPANKIERDGVNASGVIYRVNPEMTCGQMAVMMACLYANKQREVAGVLDFMELMTVG